MINKIERYCEYLSKLLSYYKGEKVKEREKKGFNEAISM